MRRPIILGMCLGPRGGTEALGVDVPGSAGRRLFDMSGMSRDDYLRTFDRRNLLLGTWNPDAAQMMAIDFALSLPSGAVVVALGKEVARALIGAPFQSGVTVHLIPHPSGRNLVYNSPENRRRVGALLRRIAG